MYDERVGENGRTGTSSDDQAVTQSDIATGDCPVDGPRDHPAARLRRLDGRNGGIVRHFTANEPQVDQIDVSADRFASDDIVEYAQSRAMCRTQPRHRVIDRADRCEFAVRQDVVEHAPISSLE